MRTRALIVAALFSAIYSLVATHAQQPADEPLVKLQSGETLVGTECLTAQELDLNRALRALKRPTYGGEQAQGGDDPPRFNPHYFIGKWTIAGVLAESALGVAGEFSGEETFSHVEGCTYESTIHGKAEDGALTVKALTVYDRRERYMVRLEQDSRGFQLLKNGRVGGDTGGYFTHHWEAPPISLKASQTRKATHVRLKGRTFVGSPESYRVQMQISEDGQPFVNYGTLWWQRQAPKQ